ncbi:MAG: DNA (cytosine-5-)-methyltransferase [Phototrophicales bacterium]|nr:MAG: DNA (cytosine-5-)-methyltransferase [Phototrophicales bacterium]
MKPPYKVPSMVEIQTLPWNGYNVVSTFSGGGGSCLGYRMAGYRVLWANEFIPAAQETYKANHPDSILNTHDIRTIHPEDILAATGLKRGELDLFDGSPPCAAFSTSGKREAGWGQVKPYSDTKQRVDDLFFEYTRILSGLQPKVFVAENVSGLVKGRAKGYFKQILQSLRDCGYTVEARLLDAQWLGVPQMRQRLIFVGVRNDLNRMPAFPKPLPYQYTLKDAWDNVNDSFSLSFKDSSLYKYWLACDKKGYHPKRLNLKRLQWNRPSNTVCQTMSNVPGTAAITHPDEPRYPTIAELKRICAFPDDFKLSGTYAQQWERLGRSVPPVMMMHIASAIRDEILCTIK